jgi:hypothetical protein
MIRKGNKMIKRILYRTLYGVGMIVCLFAGMGYSAFGVAFTAIVGLIGIGIMIAVNFLDRD